MFVLFEGNEGAGKTTHAKRLVAELHGSGEPDAKYLREPGQTKVGQAIREILLGREMKPMAPLAEFFLFLAARAQLLEQEVRPALGPVVMDRFSISTMAYQVAGRGLPLEQCLASLYLATGGLVPDVTILLMVSYEEGMRRLGKMDRERDRIENESERFHRRVIRGYRAFAGILADWNIHTIETDGLSADEVYRKVLGIPEVEKLMEGTESGAFR